MLLKSKSTSILLLFCLQFCFYHNIFAQFTPVGSGSFTNTFPGVDAANRNSFPSGSPQLSGAAVGKPVPTNDWWSSLIKSDHVGNLFNYPMALKTTNAGLVVSYIPWGVYDDQQPIVIGLTGINSSKATVSDYSDWTVTMNWNDGTRQFEATSGVAMPFIYFQKQSAENVQVKVNLGTVTVNGEMLVVENARNGADFAIYAPLGSTWTQSGTTYTSTLNGENYWSMAMIPLTASSVATVAADYKKYAYVFPINTTATWTYNETTATVRTDFAVKTEVKEGTESNMLIGLLPHQWANLSADSPQPNVNTYSSVRGEIRTLAGNTFSVENTFHGILPTLPYLNNYSEGFNVASLNQKVRRLENDGLSAWTDSYNEGQMINRLIQTARIADETGNIESRDKMIATVQERLEDWLKAEASEVAFIFYYNNTWSTMIGYPAGHGQDNNINDHHFHWGYFIHAAAFLEQYRPGWAAEWGDMINLLVRDAASPNREDDKFPFLRNFNPYSGHCWANGFATFPQGNDQESTSESMQFNSSLIHWGTITGNDEIRDLGIYLYTTEQTAIEEYWFDMYERNFSASQQYSLVSRVWGNSYDNGTFWTSDIAASYGIELYPIHGGSLYLGHNTTYADKLWKEIEANTGILTNQANDNLWHDIMWEYLAFTNPQKAINLYNSYPERNFKFGVSDAQTYYWLHSMNVLGQVDATVTADYPIAAVFSKEGERTYVAHNYTNEAISVTFSDGYILEVEANQMVTNKDIDIKSTLTSSFNSAYANGSVDLSLSIESGTATKVAFYEGNELAGEMTTTPYIFKASQLAPGIHDFYAKVYEGEKLGVSNIVSIVVGNQLPFSGTASAIPGTIEAGHYDKFEGGKGQGISYSDVSVKNEGGFRSDESVDAALVNNEGATVGWINGGEWLEYTVKVETAGLYNLSFRFASGNSSGGGPFYLELDGQAISQDIVLSSTNGWDKWATKTVENIPFKSGESVLRLAFKNGEFNIGKMTFTYQAPLTYSQPVAQAGNNIVVITPTSTANLNGSASSDPAGGNLSYNWQQIYGPSVVSFTNQAIANPQISGLEEGVYLFNLTVNNGSHADDDEVLVIVSPTTNLSPTVSISSPENNAEYYVTKAFTISASASDLDGTISEIDFMVNGSSIGKDNSEPFSITWTSSEVGEYLLTAKATDNAGNATVSSAIMVNLKPAPPCEGTSHNGDFKYRFSDAASNPTLTFISSITGVGSPTCILYYGSTASGPFPGYPVTPNTPKAITAAEGSTVYFYYTYSYPGQGEKNTANNLISYQVGTCATVVSLQVSNQTLTIDEHSATETLVGTISATYTGNNTLNFSMISGNESGVFGLDAATGALTVTNPTQLDYETNPSFSLEIEATDGTLSDVAMITVQLNDIDEFLGIDESASQAILYPNPVTDRLNIVWPIFQSATLYELSGRQILNSNQSILDLTPLPKGMYILTLMGVNNERVRVKIVKEN